MTEERAVRGRPTLPAEGAAGEAIRAYREGHGILLDELAEKTGISKSALSAIERGKSSPTVRTLERIASGLGADLDLILRPTGTPRRRKRRRSTKGATGAVQGS